VVLALVLAVAASGCGGSGASTTEDSRTVSDPLAEYPEGPTREFIVPGGDNAVQTFGREATLAERKQASRVIHKWMRARAAQDWKKDCSYFSRRYAKELTADAHEVSEGQVKSCPAALAYFGHVASGDYKNNLSGPIDSLRVGDGHGYAQYHGRDGKDWVIAVEREDGRWKVSIATALDRNK